MKKNRVFIAALVISAVVTTFAVGISGQDSKTPTPKTPPAIKTGRTKHTFEKKLTRTVKGRYLLFLPESYGRDKQPLPLILFLHGSGERGGDVGRLWKFGPPRTAGLQKGFPFIVLAPHCPKGRWWSDVDVTEMVMAMLDDVCRKYLVDENRIYLTGMSMGGFGTWSLAEQYPRRFAAIAPVCGGGGNIYLATRLKGIPIRAFHGAKDKKVPIGSARQMEWVLKRMGGKMELVVYPNLGHYIWRTTYADPKLYEWFLQHRRPAKAKPRPRQPATREAKKSGRGT